MADICPKCGKAEVGTSPTGWCDGCVVDAAAERYSDSDRARTESRTRQWGKVAAQTRADAHLATLRQQRRRQIAAVRPTRAPDSLDPWQIAIDGVAACKRLGQSFPAGRSELDDIAERLRRLAWGPDAGEEWIAKAPAKHRRQIPGQLQLFDLDVAVAAGRRAARSCSSRGSLTSARSAAPVRKGHDAEGTAHSITLGASLLKRLKGGGA